MGLVSKIVEDTHKKAIETLEHWGEKVVIGGDAAHGHAGGGHH